ncbi:MULTISPECIES: metallopeptidase family protein [unclassified Sphingomonas]|uniref:metallopeptidase family protein n=1 Tax=unclassified Sphingomonas TaxID=196159 RepID=UPI0006FECA04|nr:MULTISPECIES: metallopeptidase family protein [unclassified Sphingomonas]KQX26262.1 neutral zinc metallopeptidase [Sphingomonas sp. Root1294]KQY69331.1 neutral zinc metallopeptidase [Sphingomonas sp. Root50]KRB89591.1 neutral zinc metallopeptidase [Sphingomonas sp. Root720]
MSEGQTLAPDADRIEAIARATIAKLPPAFARHLGDVVLKIEEFADDATLAEMGIESPFDLTGLYTGLPVGSKSVDHSGTMPDMIHLYRRAILDEWVETDVTLEALVSNVVIHEIGHHFGLSDDDMHALEAMVG